MLIDELKVIVKYWSEKYQKYITVFDNNVNRAISNATSKALARLDEVECEYLITVFNSYGTKNTYFVNLIPNTILIQLNKVYGTATRSSTGKEEKLVHS